MMETFLVLTSQKVPNLPFRFKEKQWLASMFCKVKR